MEQQEHDSCGVGFVASSTGERSHRILELALQGLRNMPHRGALAADGLTGDGAGVLIELPRAFFADQAEELSGVRPLESDLAVGSFFLPHHPEERKVVYEITETALGQFGLKDIAWRWVPYNASVLGGRALDSMPRLRQIIIGRGKSCNDDEFERRLYLARRVIDVKLTEKGMTHVYMPSMSSRTLVYKGLLRADQVESFYSDLQNPEFVTRFCIIHIRFGTNTLPEWKLAHPYRCIAHNGEINTIEGNRNWMRAREREWTSKLWKHHTKDFAPVLRDDESDSASLDRALELLVLSGRDPIHVLKSMAPEPWEHKKDLTSAMWGFLEYHAAQIEPWDGPACVVFAAGNMVGAALDRNGLRPARFNRYSDGLIVMASEAGIIELPDEDVLESGRLGPGQMMVIDLQRRQFLRDADCRDHVAGLQHYDHWVKTNMVRLDDLMAQGEPISEVVSEDPALFTRQQVGFGWSLETLRDKLVPMIKTAREAVSSMGNDAAIAVLSMLPRPLVDYLKQLFAEVTNPPIDALRESIVMSLVMYLGRRLSLLEESPEHAKLLRIETPFLTSEELATIERVTDPAFKSARIRCVFPKGDDLDGYEQALKSVRDQSEAVIRKGATILILTDRGQDNQHVAIPMLQAVGMVHHHLISKGLRMRASIIAETGTAFDVHTFAVLIGYGASAVCPYLAFQALRQSALAGEHGSDINPQKALRSFQKAIEAGILKVMAKRGVSTLRSYHGAQLFSAIGLGRRLVEECFRGTVSQLGGIENEQVFRDMLTRHTAAWKPEKSELLPNGEVRDLPPGPGREVHAVDRQVVKAMHAFRRSGSRQDARSLFRLIDERPCPVFLRDLWVLSSKTSIALEEVEPVSSIIRRLVGADMSDGALSPEAHRTIAEAMNRLGTWSGSGEGGEDPERFGTVTNSAIKQVAPARFGNTPEYILNAIVVSIKMAQGAKPGEGGQLPGFKVTVRVAKNRYITPGKGAFSPAPHHDIYSIEDLKQLIEDLKQLYPGVRVCVKLVSTVGVGTIAVGVAKAGADIILISGEGGTGAAALGSIKHAGEDWETGLADAHQRLVENGLRDQVILIADGGMRTPRDIVIAGILGAEMVALGTILALAGGCVMKRECHLNTCPVGVATQDEKLRQKYTGTPEQEMFFVTELAEGVRDLLASLGQHSFADIVGHTELLRRRPLANLPEEVRPKAAQLDLTRLTVPVGRLRRTLHPADFCKASPRNELDDMIAAAHSEILQGNGQAEVEVNITNRNRNFATRLAGIIAKRFGNPGLPHPSRLVLKARGSAGQSLGAYLVPGIRIELEGEANDGVLKSACGGEVVIRPSPQVRYSWVQNVILGNFALYGATGTPDRYPRLFAAGQAGERFAVRNSGAVAVVEGVGDHACTFMTRGIVVSIGDKVGWNFGSGMTGGWAALYDQADIVPYQLHSDVKRARLSDDPERVARVRELVEEHWRGTQSPRARDILDHWETRVRHFWLVEPV
ncbi:glutamate synthase large subunit [Candidatus Uhrbacteria bacterium]|nr:glutamate synthase large subunit [Candidatus Uhrbacteria bacterium]